MTSIRYDYSGIYESSFDESINHPSFTKTHNSSLSSLSSRNASIVRSASRSSQVTGIRHPSSIQDEHDSHHAAAIQHPDDPSAWVFQYDDFEQELLEDTSPSRSVDGNSLSSPKSTSSNHEHTQIPAAAAMTSTTPSASLDKDTSVYLFDDDYSPEIRERIERSFDELFGRQSVTSSDHNSNSQISQRCMTDMMENKSLQMQESLSSRIQALEDKLGRIHLEPTNSSQRSGSALSRELDNSSTSNVTSSGNDDQEQVNRNSDPGNSQQDGDAEQIQRILDLQSFVDRVDALVWNTPFLSPADTIKSAHVCDRHRAWSEHVLRERQKTALDSLDARDRMEATFQQLIQWSNSIRDRQHR